MKLRYLLHPKEYSDKRKKDIENTANNLNILPFGEALKFRIRRIGRSNLIHFNDLIFEVERRGYKFLGEIQSDSLEELKIKAAKAGADTILAPQPLEIEAMFSGKDLGTVYWTQAYHSK